MQLFRQNDSTDDQWGPKKCFTLALQHSYGNWIPVSLHQSKELRNINKKRDWWMQDDRWNVPSMILQFFLFRVVSDWSKWAYPLCHIRENFGLAESDFRGHAPMWFSFLQGQKGTMSRAHVIIEVAWPWIAHLLQVLFLEVFAFKAWGDKLWLGFVYVFPFLNLCRQT